MRTLFFGKTGNPQVSLTINRIIIMLEEWMWVRLCLLLTYLFKRQSAHSTYALCCEKESNTCLNMSLNGHLGGWSRSRSCSTLVSAPCCGVPLPAPAASLSACNGHQQTFGAQFLVYILHSWHPVEVLGLQGISLLARWISPNSTELLMKLVLPTRRMDMSRVTNVYVTNKD